MNRSHMQKKMQNDKILLKRIGNLPTIEHPVMFKNNFIFVVACCLDFSNLDFSLKMSGEGSMQYSMPSVLQFEMALYVRFVRLAFIIFLAIR